MSCDGRQLLVLCAPNSDKRPANTNRLYSLGLQYLAHAAASVQWESAEIDAYFLDLSESETLVQIRASGSCSVIGFMLNSAGMAEAARRIVRTLRAERDTPFLVIAGGHFAARNAKSLLSEGGAFDVVVRGEGERALARILQDIAANGRVRSTASVWVRGAPTPARPPIPARSADLDEFGSLSLPSLRTLLAQQEWSIVTSRGCSAACSFCTIGPHWGRYREWRGHSAVWIHARMKEVAAAGGSYIQFVDDQFVGPPASIERAWRLVELMERDPVGVPFYILCRADCVIVEPELFSRLAACGLHTVFLGLESGNDMVLRELNKEHRVQDGVNAVQILDRLGVQSVAGTIVFHPWSTAETLTRDLNFLERLVDDFAGFYFYDLNELDVFGHTPLGAQRRPHGDDLIDWTPDDPTIAATWQIYESIRERILYPAMERLPLLRNLPLRRAICRWQIDSLRGVLDLGTSPSLAAFLRQQLFAMFAIVLEGGGAAALEALLASEPTTDVDSEHCFQ